MKHHNSCCRRWWK